MQEPFNSGFVFSSKCAAVAAFSILFAILASALPPPKPSPDRAASALNRGLALVRAGQFQQAIPALELAARDPSLASEAHFLLGVGYFGSKRYDKAIAELRGLDRSKYAERVLYMVEESNRRTGDGAGAKAAFDELITRFPNSAWVDYLMGNAYEAQKQFDRAIEAYKQALKKDPGIPDADFAIGYIYWREHDTSNAREWLQKEAARSCHSLANLYLGRIARTTGDLRQAEARFRRAAQCDPSDSEAHLRLGMVLADRKRYPQAVAQLKDAIRLQPGESSAHYHLAQIYSKMGRTTQANAEYKKVREILAAKDQGVPVSGMATRP